MTSAPRPPVSSRTTATKSSRRWSMAFSAPRLSHTAHFSGDPAVVKTRAPKARPSWIAVVPIPPEPPWTRRVSPDFSRPRSKTLAHTVKNVSGIAAAATSSRPFGTGRHCGAGATQYSAYPPPETRAQTRSLTQAPGVSSPTATTSPATSRPGMSEAPGGGAYRPCRCSRSG